MKKRCTIRYLAFVCSLLCLISLGGIAVSAENTDGADSVQSSDIQTEIEQLQKQEEELVAQLGKLEAQLVENAEAMTEAVAQKDLLDQQIVLLHEQIVNTNAQVASYTKLIADKQAELDELVVLQQQLQEKHKQRIRAMEERGKMSYWLILFRSSSITDLLDRINMIQQIMEADERSISDLRRTSTLTLVAKEELERERTRLDQAREQLTRTEQELEAKRKESDELLQKLVAKGAEYERMIEQSEEKQDNLMLQLAQKKSSYNDAAYKEWLANEKQGEEPKYYDNDTWISPLTSYKLTSPFGMRYHPVLKVDRMHNGVDMAAPANTPIYAARGGQVITASYQKDGAGNYVQLDHGDGFRSIYMHMTRYIVKVGDYVAPGQVIGYVGSTGVSTGNHLHFGISKNGKYVNPMEYIP